MITIYHNPRCRKSREALQVLRDLDLEHQVRLYLQDPLSKAEIKQLLSDLNIEPQALIRKGEAIWKSDYKGQTLSDEDLIAAMLKHPKLIERPIVSTSYGTVIGRPLENVHDLLGKS